MATLVAQGVPADELFAAVTEEVGRLLGADAAAMIRYETDDVVTAVGNWTAERGGRHEVRGQWPLESESLATRILKTGRPARKDDWTRRARSDRRLRPEQLGLSSSVGSPVFVEGRVWGTLSSTPRAGRSPRARRRVSPSFTELLATAILEREARAEVRRLADEQAALRRVATLVAREREAAEVFAAVAEEVGRLLPVENSAVLRYDVNASTTIVASWGALADVVLPGMRTPMDGENVTAMIWRTGRPARLDDYATASGALGTRMRELGIGAAVGCPIVVDGRLWGAMIAAQREHEPLPADAESRILNFTELVATAMSKAQTRADVHRLADEQTALRRMATLVAEGCVPKRAVRRGGRGGRHSVRRGPRGNDPLRERWHGDPDGHVGRRGPASARSGRLATEGTARQRRLETAGPPGRRLGRRSRAIAAFVREELGIRSSVGSPILVEGRCGAPWPSTRREPATARGHRVTAPHFTELVATAISNARRGPRWSGWRTSRRRCDGWRCWSPRITTGAIFAAVAEEIGRLLDRRCHAAGPLRAGRHGHGCGNLGPPTDAVPVGTRVSLEGESSRWCIGPGGRARIDDFTRPRRYRGVSPRLNARSAVGAPIVVGGRLWGAMVIASRRPSRWRPAPRHV